MRVEAYNKIGQVYQANQKMRTRETVKGSERDALTISETARDYQTARQALAQVPDIREARVSAIKQSMEAGTYQVNAESFAAKLIARYEELSL